MLCILRYRDRHHGFDLSSLGRNHFSLDRTHNDIRFDLWQLNAQTDQAAAGREGEDDHCGRRVLQQCAHCQSIQ